MNTNLVKVRSEFIDLLGYLEKINIDYVDINSFVGFIYMDPKNEYKYKISIVENNAETYSFKYLEEQIPNAIFFPNVLYDFDIDLVNKTFKKLDEYKIIDHLILDIDIDIKQKNKSFIRKLFGC